MNAKNDNVTTGELMDFLQEHMATKEDLALLEARMATKEDLTLLATKEDLKRSATKEDLAQQKHELLSEIDDKLANLKGDLTILMRKEDRKLVGLIGLLRKKSVLTDDETKGLMGMEPFPQSFS